jgi:hypothetical protein
MEGLRARFLMYSTAMDVFYTGLIVRLTVMHSLRTSMRLPLRAVDGFVGSNNGSNSLRDEF